MLVSPGATYGAANAGSLGMRSLFVMAAVHSIPIFQLRVNRIGSSHAYSTTVEPGSDRSGLKIKLTTLISALTSRDISNSVGIKSSTTKPQARRNDRWRFEQIWPAWKLQDSQ